MKKHLISIFMIIFFIFISNNVFATDENIKDIKYYEELAANENVVTIILDKNTVTRKTTKQETMKFDKKITQIKDGNNKQLNENDLVKTGDLITVNGNDYKVILYGDVNKDGYICSEKDIEMIQNSYLGNITLDSLQKIAGNLQNEDDTLDIEDIMKMVNTYLGHANSEIVSNIPYGSIEDFDNSGDQDDDIDNDMTPLEEHGALSVNGTNIIDENGEKFQLKGVSTHGLQWYPQYVNKETFEYMRDNWKINAVRLAMYSDPNVGYNTNLHKIVENGVEYATDAGLYVIIDWHILSDGNPNTNKVAAINFFKEMAEKYKENNNVIYEICNEPNGDVQWERDIKPYAQDVIKEIREIDEDAIIVVGTPTWSQDVDVVAKSPINGYENIMYTLHFYAATHKDYLRQKLNTALNAGLPIFVTEFGICDASGNGAEDIEEANKWIDYLNSNNISWMCWNLSNKNESSSILKNTEKLSNWTKEELSEEGKWLLEALKR